MYCYLQFKFKKTYAYDNYKKTFQTSSFHLFYFSVSNFFNGLNISTIAFFSIFCLKKTYIICYSYLIYARFIDI